MGVLSKLARFIRKKTKRKTESDQTPDSLPSQKQIRPVSSLLADNLNFMTELLGSGTDFVTSQIEMPGGQGQVGVVYLRGLADNNFINLHIIERLKNGTIKPLEPGYKKKRFGTYSKQSIDNS